MSALTHDNITVEEFARRAGRGAGRQRYELVRGEVREMSPGGFDHGIITERLHTLIGHHVMQHDLGEVATAETGFCFDEEGKASVRAPDIAFIAAARIPQESGGADSQTAGFARVAPDLVVETLSPNDRASDVNEKVLWWLRMGVRIVWIVDPRTATVTVHHPNGEAQRLTRTQTLEGGDILPGFTLALDKLFRALPPQGPSR